MTDTMQGLNKEQLDAVQTINGPMLILAGAGSGKTKVLTCRIAHLLQQGVRPYRILAITFTNKAAAEMRERVDRMAGAAARDVWLFTFHAFCARLLRYELENLNGYANNFATWNSEDPYAYVRKNVILPLTQLNEEDKNEIRNAYNKLLKLDPENLSEQNQSAIDELIQAIAGKLEGIDAEGLKISLGFNVDPNLRSEYDQAITSSAERFEKNPSQKDSAQNIDTMKESLSQFFEENSINTQKEIEEWNKIAESCDTATEAKERYLKLAVNKKGEMSYSETIKELDGMKESFSVLDSVYSKFVSNDNSIGFEDLQNISEQFKNVSGIENYVKAIQEAKGSSEEEQDAI